MTDLQARLDRAILRAREQMIGRINQALSAAKETQLERALTPMSEAIDHYAALVALRARLVAHLDYCTEKRCEETTELDAEAERLLGSGEDA